MSQALLRTLFGRPGLSEQFLRHRLLQSLSDPSRSDHGEFPKTLFGNSEPAALLQNPAHFPDEMPVEQSVARPACGPAFHSYFRFLVLAQPCAPTAGVAYALDVALTTIGWLVPPRVFRRPFGLVLVRKAWWEGEGKPVAPGCGLLP